jgi:hypothetical protein
MTWDSAVGIATGYGLDAREVEARVPVGSRNFYSPLNQALRLIQPTILWIRRTISPGEVARE